METIGLDVTLSGAEIAFLGKCAELKKFKLANGVNNPKLAKSLSLHQRQMARFQNQVPQQKTEFYKRVLQKPMLRAAFEEADSLPVTMPLVTKPINAQDATVATKEERDQGRPEDRLADYHRKAGRRIGALRIR
jgi:hypothetical protein